MRKSGGWVGVGSLRTVRAAIGIVEKTTEHWAWLELGVKMGFSQDVNRFQERSIDGTISDSDRDQHD